MKPLLIALSLAFAASASFARTAHSPAAASSGAAAATAVADGAAQPAPSQQNKMKTCNADARTKDIHGPDRRAFMKQCLSGKAKPATAS